MEIRSIEQTGPKSKNGPNFTLMLRIFAHMSAEPMRVNQNNWLLKSELAPCGTVGCFAGWTVWETTPEKQRVSLFPVDSDSYCPFDDASSAPMSGIPEKARQRLRLTRYEAAFLFSPVHPKLVPEQTRQVRQLTILAQRIEALVKKYQR